MCAVYLPLHSELKFSHHRPAVIYKKDPPKKSPYRISLPQFLFAGMLRSTPLVPPCREALIYRSCLGKDLLRRESSRSRGGIPFMYIILVGLLGLLLGYLLKKT